MAFILSGNNQQVKIEDLGGGQSRVTNLTTGHSGQFASSDVAGKLGQLGAANQTAKITATNDQGQSKTVSGAYFALNTKSGKDALGAQSPTQGATPEAPKAVDPIAEARKAGYAAGMKDSVPLAEATRDTAKMSALQSAPAWAGKAPGASVADRSAAPAPKVPVTPAFPTPSATVKTDMGEMPAGQVPGTQGGTAATGNAQDDQAARANAEAAARSALATGGLWEDRKDWTPEQNSEVRSLYANGFNNEAQARSQEIQASVDEKKNAKDKYDQYAKERGENRELQDVQRSAMEARWDADMAKAKADLKNLETNSVYMAKALGAGQDMTALAAISQGLDNANIQYKSLIQERDSATKTFAVQWEQKNRAAWYNFRQSVGTEIADAIKDMDSAQANGYLDTLSGVQDFSKQLALRLNRINGYQADFSNIQKTQNEAAKAHLDFVTNAKKVDAEQSKLQGVYIDKNGNPMVDREGAPIEFRGDAVHSVYDEESGTFTQFFADQTYQQTKVGGATPGATEAFDKDAEMMAWNVQNGYMEMAQVPDKMRRAVSTKLYGMAREGEMGQGVPAAYGQGTVPTAHSPLTTPELAMPAPKAPAGKTLTDYGVVLPETTGAAGAVRSQENYLLPSGAKGGQCGLWTNRVLNMYATGKQFGDTLESKVAVVNLPKNAIPSLNSAIVLDTGAKTLDGRNAGHVGVVVGQDADSWYVKSSNWTGETDLLTGNPVGKEEVSVVRVAKDDTRIKGFYDPSHVGAKPVTAEPNPSMTAFYDMALKGTKMTENDNDLLKQAGYPRGAINSRFRQEVEAYRDTVAFPAAIESVLKGDRTFDEAAASFGGSSAAQFSAQFEKTLEDRYPDKKEREIARSARSGKALSSEQETTLGKAAQTRMALSTLSQDLSGMNVGPIMGWLKSSNPWDKEAALAKMGEAGLAPLIAKGVFGEVGALTDSDLQRYGKTIPSITNTAAANKAAARYLEALLVKSSMMTIENALKNQKNVSGYADDYASLRKRYDELRKGMEQVTVKAKDGTFTVTPDELQAEIHDSVTFDENNRRRNSVQDVVRTLIKSGIDPLDYSLVPGETDAHEKTLRIMSNFPLTEEEKKAYERIIDSKNR